MGAMLVYLLQNNACYKIKTLYFCMDIRLVTWYDQEQT